MITNQSGRIVVFEAEAEPSEGRLGNGQAYAQLASLLDEHTRCFVGEGRMALRALEAAHEAEAPASRIILDEPEEVEPERLSSIARNETVRCSDVLILCRNSSTQAVQDSGRLLKAALPHATLMFTYTTGPMQRTESSWTAVRDFLRWGRGFIIKR